MARLVWDFQTPKTENQTGIKMKEKTSIGVVFYVGVMISTTYRRGTFPSASSTSDNEHTLAPLRQPEILSVKNCGGDPVAELFQ